ncbi:alanine racemase [Microbacterium paraoxydans]|uniref:alanine racemase n=1 Tax=Microbacterium paraoxydans TaxID=199592 RepID=UPI001CFAAF73|nr:alanine racemase [Microbacterium paraoxydans]
MTRPQLRISSAVFRANVEAVRARIAPSTLMLVLKDDAYGHGLAWAVETASKAGIDWFGSYDIASGSEVRRLAGRDARVFAWATSTDAEVDDALLHRIDLGVGTAEYLQRIIARADALGAQARVHLKIDTGLHRNGILPEDWAGVVAEARAAEAAGLLELEGVWSHIAEASDAEDDDAQAVFLDAVGVVGESGPVPPALHLTASAASWWRPEMRGSVSRIGAFCYGIRSAEGPDLEGVRPAASLVATVVEVGGDDAVISIGSFDGLPSTLRGVSVGTPRGPRTLTAVGHTTSIVGRWPGASAGDEVTLFGAGAHGESSATTLAERIDTVGEEILTRLTARVRRAVVD